MADLNGRVVQCDATVLKIAGTDYIAIANEATITISIDEIETTAPMDTWKQRAACIKDWSMTVGKLITATTGFMNLALDTAAGALVVVSANLTGGEVFVGSALITNASQTWASPQTENINLVSAGATPTIT